MLKKKLSVETSLSFMFGILSIAFKALSKIMVLNSDTGRGGGLALVYRTFRVHLSPSDAKKSRHKSTLSSFHMLRPIA